MSQVRKRKNTDAFRAFLTEESAINASLKTIPDLIFRADEEVRLSSYNDDKRKSGEIIPFQASSDWSPMLNL